MKICPYCWEEIQDVAKKCRYCWEWLEEKEEIKKTAKGKKDSFVKKANMNKGKTNKKAVKHEIEEENINNDIIPENQDDNEETSSEYVERKNILWWRFKNLVIWLFFGGLFALAVWWTLKEWTVSYRIWLVIFVIAYQWWIDDMIINSLVKKWYDSWIIEGIAYIILTIMIIADCFIMYKLFTIN